MLDLVSVRRFLREFHFNPQFLGDVLLIYDLYVDQRGDGWNVPVVLQKDGTMFVMFGIEGLDYETSGSRRIAEMVGRMKSFFEEISPHVVVQTYFVHRHEGEGDNRMTAGENRLLGRIGDMSLKFQRKLAASCYANSIYCCLKVNRVAGASADWRKTVKRDYSFVWVEEEFEENMRLLKEAALQARLSFRELGFRFLEREEMFRLLYFLVNFEETRAPFRLDLSLHAQLLRSELRFFHRHCRFNEETVVSTIPLKDLPAHTYTSMLEGFLKLDHECVLYQCFSPFDFSRYSNRFDADRRFAESTAHKIQESKDWLQDFKGYTDKLREGESSLFYNFVVLNLAKDPESLREYDNEVLNLVKAVNAHGVVETHYLRNTLFSCLPGHDIFNRRRFMILSSNAAHLINIFNLDRGDREAGERFLDRSRGLYRFNLLKHGQANHTAITGPTGSGKTFLTIRLLVAALSRMPFLFVIDPKRSYDSLFEMLAEMYPQETGIYRFTPEGVDFTINPFLMDDPEVVDESRIGYAENLLSLMIGSELLDGPGRGLVREGLETFYFEYANLLRQGHTEPPVSLLHSIFRQRKECRDIALALEAWTGGKRGRLLNSGEDRLRFNRFCYFDLRDMADKPDVVRVLSYVMFHRVKQVIEDEGLLDVFKIMVLEEAAVYLKLDEFREIAEYLVRTGRTNNLLLMLVSQSINDLFQFDGDGNILLWSNGVVTNLQNILLFGGQRNIERAFKVLELEGEFLERYQSLQTTRREFMLWTASGTKRLFTCPTDPATYWLATTDPKERVLRRETLKKHFGDITRAIRELVRRKQNG